MVIVRKSGIRNRSLKYKKKRRMTKRRVRFSTKRKMSRKRARRMTRSVRPKARGKSVGSYRRSLNPIMYARRGRGYFNTSWDSVITCATTAGTPFIQSWFFVANSVNSAAQIAYMDATMSANYIAPTALLNAYTDFRKSMVMRNSISFRFRRDDSNADYAEYQFLLTPFAYDDYANILTAAPSTTSTWLGATAGAKFENQRIYPHTRTGQTIGGAASNGPEGKTYASIYPGYIYTQPGWMTATDSNGDLRYEEGYSTPVAQNERIIWCLTAFCRYPLNTTTTRFTLQCKQLWRVRQWDPAPPQTVV